LNKLRNSKLVLVNYAHNGYFESQKKSSQTAISHGGVDRVICMGFEDLSTEFRNRNQAVLSVKRGAGWWCWKPEVILRALEQIEAQDILIYIDSGWTFKRSVRRILSPLDSHHFLLTEAIPRIENMKTGFRTILSDCKRFCLDYYGIEPGSKEAGHRLISAGFIAMRNTDYVKSFMRTWQGNMLHDVLMIDDRYDIPKPEFPGFLRHMNDMGSFNALLALKGGYFAIGNDTKLSFLDRIWPREVEYKTKPPERRV